MDVRRETVRGKLPRRLIAVTPMDYLMLRHSALTTRWQWSATVWPEGWRPSTASVQSKDLDIEQIWIQLICFNSTRVKMVMIHHNKDMVLKQSRVNSFIISTMDNEVFSTIQTLWTNSLTQRDKNNFHYAVDTTKHAENRTGDPTWVNILPQGKQKHISIWKDE